jgi:hypothetical protein
VTLGLFGQVVVLDMQGMTSSCMSCTFVSAAFAGSTVSAFTCALIASAGFVVLSKQVLLLAFYAAVVYE